MTKVGQALQAGSRGLEIREVRDRQEGTMPSPSLRGAVV